MANLVIAMNKSVDSIKGDVFDVDIRRRNTLSTEQSQLFECVERLRQKLLNIVEMKNVETFS